MIPRCARSEIRLSVHTYNVRRSFNPHRVITMIYSFARGIIVIEYQRA